MPKAASPVSLTPRELEVLSRVVTGKTNHLIAQDLHVSLSTVKRHLERLPHHPRVVRLDALLDPVSMNLD